MLTLPPQHNQVACFQTKTNAKTHEIVNANLHRSVHIRETIKGASTHNGCCKGPELCAQVLATARPSSPRSSASVTSSATRSGLSLRATTVVSDARRVGCWSDADMVATDLIYPNGISMTLPPDAQHEMLRTIAGLEHVEMVQPGAWICSTRRCSRLTL